MNTRHRSNMLKHLFDQYEKTEHHPGVVHTHSDYFSLLRLLLPRNDKERNVFHIKDAKMAAALAQGLGLGKDTEEALRLKNWRTAGGEGTGNLAMVARSILKGRCRSTGCSIAEVNKYLDRLAGDSVDADTSDPNARFGEGKYGQGVKTSKHQADLLAEMSDRFGEVEMFWIIKVILKDDFRLGCGERAIFSAFHQDAAEVMNTTSSLREVAVACGRNRDERVKRREIEVGTCVRAMTAQKAYSPQDAAMRREIKGKDTVVECKFDGERAQVHFERTGGAGDFKLNMFSRNLKDHAGKYKAIGTVLDKALNQEVTRVILDCEIVGYSEEHFKATQSGFIAFGTLANIANSINRGHTPDGWPDAELALLVFDMLYVNDSSVNHYTLAERHAEMRKFISPHRVPRVGSVDLVLPDRTPILPGRKLPYSRRAERGGSRAVELIQRAFNESIDHAEEGILVKSLASKWEAGLRSGAWLKIKPDYIKGRVDLDCIIIGGYYGTNRRGGDISEYLVALLKQPAAPGAEPTHYESFAKVGGGFSEEDRRTLREKMRDHYIPYEQGTPPEYTVTHHRMERPHVWIKPGHGIALQIAADIRLIHTEVFAAAYSLRFPRCERVRYDKPIRDCLTDQGLNDIIAANREKGGQGAMLLSKDQAQGEGITPKAMKKQRQVKARRAQVEQRYQLLDTTHVEKVASWLQGMKVHVVQGDAEVKKSVEEQVARCGGTSIANLPAIKNKARLGAGAKRKLEELGPEASPYGEDVVVIASTDRGVALDGHEQFDKVDVLSSMWLDDCERCGNLITPPLARHYVFMCSATKVRRADEIDEFGDSFTEEVTSGQLEALLRRMSPKKATASDEAGVRAALIAEYPELRTRRERLAGLRLLLLPSAAVTQRRQQQVDDLRALAYRARCVGAEVVIGGAGGASARLATMPKGAVRPSHVVVFDDPLKGLMGDAGEQSGCGAAKVDAKSAQACGARLVKHAWLERCIKQGEHVGEAPFLLDL